MGVSGNLCSCLKEVKPIVVYDVERGISIFSKSQASSPFEALNTECLSRCQRDVKPPGQMRRGPRAFFRVSTGDSDIPSSGEMKDDPAFKTLQGYPTFFLVRASQYPLHLRQQTQGPSHLPIYEGCLLLRCFWNVGLPVQSMPGNQLSSFVFFFI